MLTYVLTFSLHGYQYREEIVGFRAAIGRKVLSIRLGASDVLLLPLEGED